MYIIKAREIIKAVHIHIQTEDAFTTHKSHVMHAVAHISTRGLKRFVRARIRTPFETDHMEVQVNAAKAHIAPRVAPDCIDRQVRPRSAPYSTHFGASLAASLPA